MQTFAKCAMLLLLSLAAVVYAGGGGNGVKIEIRKMPEPPREPQAIYARIANTTLYAVNCHVQASHTDFWGYSRVVQNHNFWVRAGKYSRWYPLGSIGNSWIWSCK